MNKKIMFGFVCLFVVLIGIGFVSSEYIRSGAQFIQPGLTSGISGGGYATTQCGEPGQDFIVQIAPFGCSPIVRSDLLEEQNVPVFCQLAATKINPLINVELIEDISFSGQYPPEISGIGFHPARAALGNKDVRLNSPVLNNIGYVVIVLKKQEDASKIPEYVEGTLTARLKYDTQNAFGIGKSSFYLPVLYDDKWESKKVQYSFWNGRYYVRVEGMDNEGATISLYDGIRKVQSNNIKIGETSDTIYMPGFNCLAGLDVKLNSLENPDTRAKLNINGQIIEVGAGEQFLENRCKVISGPLKQGLVQRVGLSCKTDEKRGDEFELVISPKVSLSICDKGGVNCDEKKEYGIGDYLYDSNADGKYVYLGYIGTYEGTLNEKDLYVRFFESPNRVGNLSSKDLSEIARYDGFFDVSNGVSEIRKNTESVLKKAFEWGSTPWNLVKDGEYHVVVDYGVEKEVLGKKVKVNGFTESYNVEFGNKVLEEDYKAALENYNKILEVYSSEAYVEPGSEGITYGEMALRNKIILSRDTGQEKTMIEWCDEFKEVYPSSLKIEEIKGICQPYKFSGADLYSNKIIINRKVKDISFEGVYEPSFEDYGVKISVNNEDFSLKKNDIIYLGEGAVSEEVSGDVVYNFRTDRNKPDFEKAVKDKFGSDCERYSEDVYKSAKDNDVDPFLVMALIRQESTCGKAIDSGQTSGLTFDGGASYGVMQISGRNWCGQFGLPGKDTEEDRNACIKMLKEDTTKNIEVGIKILKSYNTDKSLHYYCEAFRDDNQDEPERDIIYTGWKAALRRYNGGGCAGPNDNKVYIWADHSFVEDILEKFVSLGGTFTGGKGIAGEYIQLKDLEKDYAVFDVNIKESSAREVAWKKNSIKVNLNNFEAVGKYKIFVSDINLEKFAHVSIDPNIDRKWSEAQFPFKISVEKRTIKLTPEKTKERIDKVNNLISGWESATDKVGKLVKTMKTACVVTGTYLTAKNFISNAGGKALARKKVMRDSGGWYDKCSALSKGGGGSVDACLAENGDIIEAEIERTYELMKSQQEKMDGIRGSVKSVKEGALGDKVYPEDEILEKYILDRRKELKEAGLDEDFLNSLNNETITLEEYRELVLNSRLSKEGGLMGDVAKESMDLMVKDVSESAKRINDYQKNIDGLKENKNLENVGYSILRDENTLDSDYEGGKVVGEKGFGDIPKDSKIHQITYNGETYMVKLAEPPDKNEYHVEEVFHENGSRIIPPYSDYTDARIDIIKNNLILTEYDDSSYKNNYLNPEVRYFDREPYKGQPALVPFDKKNGWYVILKQKYPNIGGIESYDESGVPRSFTICNVGENRLEEYNMDRDDKCQLYNRGTGQPYKQFNGLNAEKAGELYDNAMKAIEEADKGRGNKEVKINGQWFDVGTPMTDIPDIKCQDTMSAVDCKLLFNVCDPVICPSSRCDFGGKFPVGDVIQSGITGSVALCAPNFVGFGGDVYIPICLSGLHAGMDGWLQVQKSYKDCLETNLNTGKMTGICDEVYGFHACEFFWRQGIPTAKILLPRAFDLITGGNTRGGGEYLGFKSALDNAGQSVNYFTNYYAENSFAAFKSRSADQIGGEVCKNYASGVLPSASSFLDVLTEPDSPAQFHGRFDEIPYTTATNPPTSQYKVWYFIYAGNDRGGYYQVYLSGPSESFYYEDVGYKQVVAQGYLAPGERVDETPDFLAASGYKELCIRVNEYEECGFKQISTEFVVDYVKDKYMQEQASQENIKSTSQCIAGTASAYSLLSPSLEGAASEIVNPEIYNRGIIRICATGNPGEGSDNKWNNPNESRWKYVGVCDEANMGCWLDTKSVKDIIQNQGIEDEVLGQHAANQLETLRNENGLISPDDFKNNLSSIKKGDDERKKIELLNELWKRIFLNSEKAEISLYRGDIYSILAGRGYKPKITIPTALADDIDLDLDDDVSSIPDKIGDDFSDVSPVFEFEDLKYSFSSGQWYFSTGEGIVGINTLDAMITSQIANPNKPDEFLPSDAYAGVDTPFEIRYYSGLSEENKKFVLELAGKDYGEGVGFLAESVSQIAPLRTELVVLISNGMFTFNGDGKNLEDIFFRYKDNTWEWMYTPYKREWYKIPSDISKGVFYDLFGKDVPPYRLYMDSLHEKMIVSLSQKSELEGTMTIFDFNRDSFFVDESILQRLDKDIQEEIEDEVRCNDCGKGTFDVCSEAQCNEIGRLTGRKCIYVDEFFLAPGGTCYESILPCSSPESCKKVIGEEIIKIAIEKKQENNIQDSEVVQYTQANSFECLVLQLAMFESRLDHCTSPDKEKDALYCEADFTEITNFDDFSNYGVMGLDLTGYNSVELSSFSYFIENVEKGIDVLIEEYSENTQTYKCNGKSYFGWQWALREYDGSDERKCAEQDIRYVENVFAQKGEVGKLFSQCA